MLFCSIANAENSQDLCKQILVVGDLNWPPYAVAKQSNSDPNALGDANVEGIGIELVSKIFAELDIPVRILPLDNKRNMLNGLHLGDIDIMVSTYANTEMQEILDLIKPGYVLDPLVVYMRKGENLSIKRWDDLVGKRGVMTDHFAFNDKFGDYARRYLYVHTKGNLATVLELLANFKADYVIGSRLQLEHGIKQANLQEELELVAGLFDPGEIHMGYSKRSECRAYLPYLRRRLLELKTDGSVNDIVTRYLAKDLLPQSDESGNAVVSERFDPKNPAGLAIQSARHNTTEATPNMPAQVPLLQQVKKPKSPVINILPEFVVVPDQKVAKPDQ